MDQVLIHWSEVGDGPRVPTVLLHGLNDSNLSWKRVAPLLATDRRVLMPDLPGHGLSGRPDASYALGWYARMMADWLESIGLEQVDLVGHSFGGGVAQRMLLECRKRIRRMVLVSSGGLGREIAWSLRLASIPRVVESFGQPFMRTGTQLAMRAAGFHAEDIAELSAMNARRGSARAFARTVKDIIDWRGQRRAFLDGAGEIADLPPIAVFWGDRDVVIPLAHARAFVASVDGVRLTVFEGSGHFLHHEHPETFVRALRDFLDAPVVPLPHLRLG